ncbi:hypothetical protein [Natronorubrum sp. DTA7]|uniref:hypothetical protein n=1 Tax=Natronorubrum sp. DTA7 TaxID=3447016 RepID=UPI003F824ADA
MESNGNGPDHEIVAGEVDFENVVDDVRMHHAAFEMFLAGYRQRIRDEQEQPSSLRDERDFQSHVRKGFEREWKAVKPGVDDAGE